MQGGRGSDPAAGTRGFADKLKEERNNGGSIGGTKRQHERSGSWRIAVSRDSRCMGGKKKNIVTEKAPGKHACIRGEGGKKIEWLRKRSMHFRGRKKKVQKVAAQEFTRICTRSETGGRLYHKAKANC